MYYSNTVVLCIVHVPVLVARECRVISKRRNAYSGRAFPGIRRGMPDASTAQGNQPLLLVQLRMARTAGRVPTSVATQPAKHDCIDAFRTHIRPHLVTYLLLGHAGWDMRDRFGIAELFLIELDCRPSGISSACLDTRRQPRQPQRAPPLTRWHGQRIDLISIRNNAVKIHT